MARFILYWLIFLSVIHIRDAFYDSIQKTSVAEDGGGDSCFCKLKGEVDDCSCKVENVDSFNNLKVYPRLNSLLNTNYFRYWKVNLRRECPFWGDDGRCSLKECAVDDCKEDDLPDALRQNHSKKNKYTQEANEGGERCEKDNELGILDHTISDKSREAFKVWSRYDDAQDNFCELDDDNSNDASYVDLLLNPEAYTGYKGRSPHRIWHSIYNENCFKPERKDYATFIPTQTDMCLEKRVFYRLISGLHTSINIHLSAKYFFPDKLGLTPGKWDMNIEEFRQRYHPETTNGEGPQRLKNLYFTYLVEMRALAKVAPYLEKEEYYTGNDVNDRETKEAVKDFLKVVKTFPNHFDESKLFRGSSQQEVAQLKHDFKSHFYNISRIMDCVGCDKCKLWGKLQVTGMGTALKILFSGEDFGGESTLTQENKHMEQPFQFQLRRQEIISLFNAFGRLSESIREVDEFRKLMT